MEKTYRYEADWRPYAFPEDFSHLAVPEEIRSAYPTVDMTAHKRLDAGGFSMLTNGTTAVINPNNENTMIYGQTRSGKSRVVLGPLICTLAKAGESMIVTDPKGELSQGSLARYIIPTLEANGYRIIVWDSRSCDKDGINPLEHAYRLYRRGDKDAAEAEIKATRYTLCQDYHSENARADPFWHMIGESGLAALIRLVFELCDAPEQVNFLTLAQLTTEEGFAYVQGILDLLERNNSGTIASLRNIASAPEKTKASLLATIHSFVADFLSNDAMLRMCSTSTFEIRELYEKPTALFFVVPDETSADASVVGLLMGQIARSLLHDAATMFGGVLPRRVNYVCDEFPNFPMKDMDRALSAHLGRNIRYYLAVQSEKQLRAVYPKECDAILANCKNTIFLSSPEEELLEALSRRAGATNQTLSGQSERLVPAEGLRHLRKTWEYTEAFISAGNMNFITRLPDISQYPFPESDRPTAVPSRAFNAPPVFTPKEMAEKVFDLKEAYLRFQKEGRSGMAQDDLEMAKKFKTMLGGI